jgi:prepilin-type N-terminal cleavage/methylation domain-containing protein
VTHPGRAERDGGLTLIELLVVISILGILVVSLSGAILTILATAPSTEIRVDDARSTRGLATWLAQDSTSAPPYRSVNDKGWIDTSPTRNDCGGSGDNIVHFSWREVGFATTTFVANYRFVVENGEGRVVRYTCSFVSSSSASSSSASSTSAVSLTSGLDPLTPPTIGLHPETGDVVSVDFNLTATSGAVVQIRTSSRNPVEFYP